MERALREILGANNFTEVTPIVSKMMKAIKGKGNKTTELKFCVALENEGLFGWRIQEKLIGNPDIYFPSYKIAIFLDGCFWHGCPRCGHIPKTNSLYWQAKIENNKIRDSKKTLALKEQGYFVIRFWEHALHENLENCIKIVKDVIEDRLSNLIYQDWEC